MKKGFSVLLVLMLLLYATACGGNTANRTGKNNTKTVADILNENNSSDSNISVTQKSDSDISALKCDVDLTVMNSTMVYAEVSNMMNNPQDYIGKTVKMKGSFSIYQTEERNYYACLIADATACCSQGIEFVLKEQKKYPEEYPELGAEITVVGKFETYFEGDMRYCQLANADMA